MSWLLQANQKVSLAIEPNLYTKMPKLVTFPSTENVKDQTQSDPIIIGLYSKEMIMHTA